MNPRGRPFEPGNQMGRGRPKGSRNKTRAAVQELLERSELAVVAQIIRQAVQGDPASQRLLMSVYPSLPRPRSRRMRIPPMRTAEDLMNVVEQTTQQASRGEITPAEAKTRMQGVELIGKLAEQRSQEEKKQRPQKEPLPAFMREGLEAAREQWAQRKAAKAEAEKNALEGSGDNPP